MTMLHELKPPLEEAIEHYGVKGMKWGVRRNESLLKKAKKQHKKGVKAEQKSQKAASKGKVQKASDKAMKADKAFKKSDKALQKSQIDPVTRNRRLATGAAVVGLGLATYGAMKIPGAIDSAQASATRKALAKEVAANRNQKKAKQLSVLKEAQRNNRQYEIGRQIGENWLKAPEGQSELLRVWSTALPK